MIVSFNTYECGDLEHALRVALEKWRLDYEQKRFLTESERELYERWSELLDVFEAIDY